MFSFFIHIDTSSCKDILQIEQNLFAQHGCRTESSYASIGYSTQNEHMNMHDTDYILIGKVDNIQHLKSTSGQQQPIEICVDLFRQKGWNFLSLLKGCFAFIIYHRQLHTIEYSIGQTGLMQAYIYATASSVFITSELKALRHTDFLQRKMIPIDTYQYEYTKKVAPDFCFLQDIQRVQPGYMYRIDYNDIQRVQISPVALSPVLSGSLDITKKAAKEKIYALLNENIQDKINTQRIGIPVSGGLDSGLVASLVHRQHPHIHTYTIGTPFGNEYDHARDVHHYLQSTHREIAIDEEGFWEGFLQCLWHNEICDPLYAEGYVGFYHVFKAAQQEVSQLFTGYGADLILGDFLLIPDRSTINTFSEYWCKRAAWTGEMSAYTAQSFGLEIQHPFWEIDLINFSLSIPYTYKYLDHEVKALLREMASEKKLLPDAIAWRKKNAFTTGASLDRFFSHCLQIPYEKNYRFKSIFLYYLFEAIFVYDLQPKDIDIASFISKTRRHVG